MEMSLLAFILLAVEIVIFFKKESLKTKTIHAFIRWILVGSLVTSGFFMRLSGQTEFSFSDFYLVVVFLYSLLYLARYKPKIDSRLILAGFLFLIVSFISWIPRIFGTETVYSMISSSSKFNWDNFLIDRIGLVPVEIQKNSFFLFAKFCMAVSIFAIIPLKKTIHDHYFHKGVVACSLLLGVYLLIECFSPDQARSFVRGITGFGKADYYYGVGRLLGFSKEPSMLAIPLFVFALFYFSQLVTEKEKIRKAFCVFAILLSCAFLLISKSFSALYYLACFALTALLFYLKNKRIIHVSLFVIIGIAGLAFVFQNDYFSSRIDTVLYTLRNISNVNALPPVSESIRFYSNYYLFTLFLSHPLFGVGFGTTYSFGAFFHSLGTVGVIGTALLLFMNFHIQKKIFKKTSICSFVVFMVLILLSEQMGAMMLYYTPFFLILFIITGIFNDVDFKKEQRLIFMNLHSKKSKVCLIKLKNE